MSLFGNILGSIGSAILGRSQQRSADRAAREMSEREIAFEREAIGLRANEDRRTAKEAALLQEWMRQNKRGERVRGAKNFTGFAGSEFRNYTPAASANGRQVTPDEFISSGGLLASLANPPTPAATLATPAPASGGLIGNLTNALFPRTP
jgi:hypothetical protein